MIEPEKTQFFVELLKVVKLRSAKDNLENDQLQLFWKALKEYHLSQVLRALELEVKFGLKYRITPSMIVARIEGKNDRGDTKEPTEGVDRRCMFEVNQIRCPAPTSWYGLGNRGYCREHEAHKGDPAHMQRILDEYAQHGVPFEPRTPKRQLAEFLFETQGAKGVLAQLDMAHLNWLRKQEALGLVRELRMPMAPTVPGVTSRGGHTPDHMRDLAENAGRDHHQAAPESEEMFP